MLHSAVQLKEHGLSDPELLSAAEVRIAETLKRLSQYLKDWVGSSHVIGGPSFGHPQLKSAIQELKVMKFGVYVSLLLGNSLPFINSCVAMGVHPSDRLSRENSYQVAQECSRDYL